LPVIIQQMMHSGPLPAPAQLGEYEAVYPGAAKWIFDQAEKNAEHARTMERRAMELQGRDTLLHRILPFGGVVAFLVASAVIAFASPAAGAVGLFATMGGVLYAYLTGRAPPPTQQPPAPPATPP
jgi:uncharacterized membrane protein